MKESPGYLLFSGINYMALTLLALATCYPFYFILIYSLSDPSLVVGHPSFLLPKHLSLVNYVEIFRKNDLTGPLAISVSRTVLGTLLTLIGCSMFAFGLTKRATPPRATRASSTRPAAIRIATAHDTTAKAYDSRSRTL